MADWDDEDFEPVAVTKGETDKWEGEDEDNIKSNWDDDDPEENEEDDGPKAVQVKKKKPLKERIAEKEEKAKQEAEERKKKAEMAKRKLNPEEMASEKLRQQREIEEADLKIARETLGITNDDIEGLKSIESMHPTTLEEFSVLKNKIVTKFNTLERSIHYTNFLEDLLRDLTITLDAEDTKRLSSTLNAVANEKVKIQKTTKKKKSKKPNVAVTKANDFADFGGEGAGFDDNDFDEFM